MTPFFTRRPPAPRGTTTTVAAPAAGQVDRACESYSPGHQMHYIHQGQALRSPSSPARNVIVDEDRIIVLLEDSTQSDYWHHDPDRLRRVLGLFPASRTLYTSFHALRVGPYWFNLSPEPLTPCPTEPLA